MDELGRSHLGTAYRKIHVYDAKGFGQSPFIKPGSSTEPVVFESGGSGVRPDDLLRPPVPGAGQVLADAGSQVLLVCSSWGPGMHKTEHWLAVAEIGRPPLIDGCNMLDRRFWQPSCGKF